MVKKPGRFLHLSVRFPSRVRVMVSVLGWGPIRFFKSNPLLLLFDSVFYPDELDLRLVGRLIPLIDLIGSTSHRSSMYTDIWDK